MVRQWANCSPASGSGVMAEYAVFVYALVFAALAADRMLNG